MEMDASVAKAIAGLSLEFAEHLAREVRAFALHAKRQTGEQYIVTPDGPFCKKIAQGP